MDWMIEYGLWSLAFLMLLQNLIPLLPSEVIMPLAGFLASMGYLDLRSAIVAGLLGSLLGHLPWYAAGHALGHDRLNGWAARHGRWVGLRPDHVRRSDAWFHKNTGRAVMFGRLIPGLRTIINIPAGAARMPLLPFLGYTALGDALWTGCLAWAGYTLGGEYQAISWYAHVFVLPALLFVAGFLLWKARHGSPAAAPRDFAPAPRAYQRSLVFRRKPWRLRLPGLPRGV